MISRSVGFAATIVLLFAIVVPPFVGPETLIAKLQPYLSSLQQEATSAQLPKLMSLVTLSGFFFLILGVFLGVMCFGLRFRPRKARSGMALSAVGLLLITGTLFDFSGGVISRIFTVVQVGAWPSLGFFGTGYFIAWIAIIAALLSTGTHAEVTRPTPRKQTLQPQVLEDTIPTGYVALDSILNGGLPIGSSIVLTAPPCDEKNLILTRFAETSLALGRKCIYISTSIDRVRNLLRYTNSFYVIICNPQTDTIAAAHPDVVRLSSVDSLTALNLEYDKAISKMRSERPAVLCLEVLDDVILAHHAASRRWLMDILGRSKANQITCLATFNPEMHPAGESQAVLETFDGHIDLYEAEVQVRPKLIRVKKLGGRRFLDSDMRVEKDKI
jgi:KaiC/GvpD/RAD55 family RecA-like ATPase